MQFVDGKNVRQLLTGAADLQSALSITIQVADALAAERARIVHRDIKPATSW